MLKRGSANALFYAFTSLTLLMISSTAYALDAAQFLENIANTLDPFSKLVTGGAYLFGLAFFFKAMYHLKVYGEARTMMSTQTSLRQPLTYLLIGAAFLYLPTAVDLMLSTTFGSDNILAYSEWEGNTQYGGVSMDAIFKIIQFVGLVAFLRGWLLLSQTAGQGAQPQAFGKALTHILGGILAMNVVGTANILSATMGINF